MYFVSAFRRSSAFRCFLVLFAVALAWSLYTQHAWEDYYITYRASKNLAAGHGLTFTAGERVHSFTSPLGVLLPAVASLLTANSSDVAALWIFRLMSISAYAGAGVLLWKLARRLYATRAAALLLVALFATDTKIVDFSTNGMETGFLLLFLAWTLHALFTAPKRQVIHLGLAWAGLMWTRPDSFIYIAALAAGALVFRPRAAAEQTRTQFIITAIRAGLITALIYLPWLLWAWKYYGSPIPNTVIAKGLFSEPTTLARLWQTAAGFPHKVAVYHDILATTFMPAYSIGTGWPGIAFQLSYWISVAVMIVWALPRIRPEARVVAIGFLAGQYYLTTYVQFPVPWYIPTLTLFAFVVVTNLFDQFLVAQPWLQRVSLWPAAVLVAAALCIFGPAAQQLRWQQRLIEEGQRTVMGKWLRSHAVTPRDTVFLEPLGYIGFYSNLKMLDYPGLSSPEVIAARKRATSHAYPDCWPVLIFDLQPDWLVLRSYEVAPIRANVPELLSRYYTLAQVFDVRASVDQIPYLPGRGYLTNDAYFEVYKRTRTWPDANGYLVRMSLITAASLLENDANGTPMKDIGVNFSAHAPSKLSFNKPTGARWLAGSFWIADGAYANPKEGTDGATFVVRWLAKAGSDRELLRRALDPRNVPADRGPQTLNVEVPQNEEGQLVLTVEPGPNGSNAFDWAYWSSLVLITSIE